MKVTTGRYEKFGTPSWAVLLAAMLAMAVSVSLAHRSITAPVHPPTTQVSRSGVERIALPFTSLPPSGTIPDRSGLRAL